MNFSDLLSIDTPGGCEMVSGATACLLIIGDGAAALAAQLAAAGNLTRASGAARVLFGRPVRTLPYPILVNSLMTERNTRLDQLSVFGWIEDNAILEPRAEIFGLTPLGDDPVLFIRDIDLDRPPECFTMPKPGPQGAWSRVAGVIIARADYAGVPAGVPVTLSPTEGALNALEVVLPASAQAFVASLRGEAAAAVTGRELRQILRARRRGADPALMMVCDGWRVLARAARFILANPKPDPAAPVLQQFRLDALRKW